MHGMTHKQIDRLSKRLAKILNIEKAKIDEAFHIITREDVHRIARNEPEDEENE